MNKNKVLISTYFKNLLKNMIFNPLNGFVSYDPLPYPNHMSPCSLRPPSPSSPPSPSLSESLSQHLHLYHPQMGIPLYNVGVQICLGPTTSPFLLGLGLGNHTSPSSLIWMVSPTTIPHRCLSKSMIPSLCIWPHLFVLWFYIFILSSNGFNLMIHFQRLRL